MTDTQWPVFEVFHQQARGEPHVYVGSVHATDAEMALLLAKEQYARRQACVNLWVVPAAGGAVAVPRRRAALTVPKPKPGGGGRTVVVERRRNRPRRIMRFGGAPRTRAFSAAMTSTGYQP